MAGMLSRPMTVLSLGGRRQRRQRPQPQVYLVAPPEGLLTLALAPRDEIQGPLAGPEAFPEMTLGSMPGYGPGRPQTSGETGFFLDRYVY